MLAQALACDHVTLQATWRVSKSPQQQAIHVVSMQQQQQQRNQQKMLDSCISTVNQVMMSGAVRDHFLDHSKSLEV